MRSMRAGGAAGAALVTLLAAGCGEGSAATPGGEAEVASRIPVRQAAAAGGESFAPRVPRLAPDQRPADTLRMHRSLGDSSVFARISSLRVLGERLLVTDRMMGSHLVVLDRATGAVLRREGRDGEGPGEFRDPFWTIPISDDPPAAWIYDFQNRRLTRFDLEGDARPATWPTRTLDVGLALTSPFWTRRGMVSNGLFPDFTLLMMDSAGTPRERVALEPPFGERQMRSLDGRIMLNRSFLAVPPSGERMAVVYQFAPRIEFLDSAGERYGTARGPRPSRASFAMQRGRFVWKADNEMAYWGAYATDRFLYLLWCGCRMDEERLPSVVHVFRWDGAFVRELALDREVMELAVSPDDAVLYAGVEAPYPAVGEWRLPPM